MTSCRGRVQDTVCIPVGICFSASGCFDDLCTSVAVGVKPLKDINQHVFYREILSSRDCQTPIMSHTWVLPSQLLV
ncbi:hypothetical protein GMOD_00003142 [Pyrenophora seminiperda CCB06]|uniref:Uncharacterized protein n=1 Tax=Pyrenophora seminiperda CCB06 TaxID=1302712 RepID=A0A3M7M410_9PLEO|nr:hypothetical protein GMOD_00003142 [Pyrenophora seminiperda CCB06]